MVGPVGESGSGKSTVGSCILRLIEPTGGTILPKGTDITHLSRRAMRPLRREMHMVFQDPYSSLNPPVQAAILNLLGDLQRERGFACLLITHDLSIVEHFCDRVIVMYLGRVVETGAREQIFSAPQHPYTQALLSAAVVPDPDAQRRRERITLAGDLPSPIDPPSGCAFRTRCPLAHESLPRPEEEVPELRDVDGDGHLVACHPARRGRGVPRLGERIGPRADHLAGR